MVPLDVNFVPHYLCKSGEVPRFSSFVKEDFIHPRYSRPMILMSTVEEIVSLEVQLKDKDEEIYELEVKFEDEIGSLKEELNDKNYEIDHLEETLREEETILEFELSEKDGEIYQLTKQKNLLEKALNNKRKIEDQGSKGKMRKLK